MNVRRIVRVIFVLLTGLALLLTLSPVTWPEENPEAATAGGLTIAASFALIAVFPSWRGLLLAPAALCFGLALLPPAAGDPDPEASTRIAVGVGIVLLAAALWPSVARIRRRMTDKQPPP